MLPRLNYSDEGKGEPTAVFLHYFGGSSKTWNEVIELLKDDFRCVAVDLPGFGDSAAVEGEPTVENTTTKVRVWLNDLGLKSFVLIGHSMGGKIAQALASKGVNGLQGLILIAPSPPVPEPMNDVQEKELSDAFGNKEALQKIAKGLVAKPLSEERVEAIVANNLRIDKKAWNGWIYTGSQEDISSRMKTVAVPLTVISGDSDPNFSTALLKETFNRYFSGVDFIEIKEAGHLIPVEQPQALAAAISNRLCQR